MVWFQEEMGKAPRTVLCEAWSQAKHCVWGRAVQPLPACTKALGSPLALPKSKQKPGRLSLSSAGLY